ncbi:CRISPR-associated protein Csx11 [Methanothermobacter sp. THM-2]|uniref:CRISPR-associated protein Csx11 n=1 Tax=Methanothermobacter sp. THM-2 TaxID=2606912 RepID=UPI001365DC8E|nr:CRISPR-associated protein Csx11 [Methanothermobacter sp. THM-2]QHN08738.1 CRISPR-associated protein Csx11 [Methanothermobacter sp. THM-2]
MSECPNNDKEDALHIIMERKDEILTAEIGALLHDIGKCHPDFIVSKSLEGGTYSHTKIESILSGELVDLLRDEKFRVGETDIYTLIREHHTKSGSSKYLQLLRICDRLDSADDKGIVTKKQPVENTVISTPFGYPKEAIDLKCLMKRFEDLERTLHDLLRHYVDGDDMGLSSLRNSLISTLRNTFTHALGETRIPANDVTLWDHSRSTASLFKSMVCHEILDGGENSPAEVNPEWRVLGFCWDGEEFINRGKRIADILTRERIIEDIKVALKRKFEEEIPVGNVIYEDINGIYITFPGIDREKNWKFIKDCAMEGYQIIRDMSDDEIWPFVLLSERSRSLTIMKSCLEFAERKRRIPKRSPVIFCEGDEKYLEYGSAPTAADEGDICPVCRLRSKAIDRAACEVCDERRRGRLDRWLDGGEDTVWIDEVADENNRIALITLSLNLSRWLDGTMLRTIYSRTPEEWYSKAKKIKENRQFMEKIKKSIQRELNVDSPQELAEYLMEYFVKEALRDPEFKDPQDKISLRAKILDTFFEDITISENKNKNSLFVGVAWKNFKRREQSNDVKHILTSLFTQNPSPARLYRIWNETGEFLDSLMDGIRDRVYNSKWKRLRFHVDSKMEVIKDNDKTEVTKDNDKMEVIKDTEHERKGFIIKIDGLQPEYLLAFHESNGEFYTIESLSKYTFHGEKGKDAVRKALKKEGITWLSPEDDPEMNLLNGDHALSINILKEEEYTPMIKIKGAPTLLQIIVPASDSMKIIELIMCLYSERFRKVTGKLPLNLGLLVAGRKFPLYMLLDAGERLLNGDEFQKPEMLDPWWELQCMESDPYYGFYPTYSRDEYSIMDLEWLTSGGIYHLQPGYFDFEMLSATDDRYLITYDNGRRNTPEHRLYSARPLYLHMIPNMIRLWEVLRSNLSNSKMNSLEENLTSRLRELRGVRDPSREIVFKRFALASLMDAFNGKWKSLRSETQDFILRSAVDGFLLDTLVLFRHILKEDGNEN